VDNTESKEPPKSTSIESTNTKSKSREHKDC
jgi:hypothetical protein